MESRELIYDPNYVPCPTAPGDEIYVKGTLSLNITAVLKSISAGEIQCPCEDLNIKTWFLINFQQQGTIHETHLDKVDLKKPIVLAERKPGAFTVVDGHHRMAKARRDGVENIKAYKISGKDFISFFTTLESYEKFLWDWNEDLASFMMFR